MTTIDELYQAQIDQLDEAITKLEEKLKKSEPLRDKRDRLRRARSALTGGVGPTGAGTTQIRQQDVVDYLKDNPGSTLTEIARALKAETTKISSHLNRGKNERFLNYDKKWWVRNPKEGLNTEEDCQDWLKEQGEEDDDD